MKSKFSQQLIKDLANSHNLTPKEVESVVRSQFEFQHDIQTNKCNKKLLYFPTTRIYGLGTFLVTEKQRSILYKNKMNGITHLKQEDI